MAIPINTSSGVVYVVSWTGTLTGSSLTLSSTQGLRVSNGSNLEYGEVAWASNFLNVRTVTNGGTARAIRLGSAASGSTVIFAPAGSDTYALSTTGPTLFSGLTTVGKGVPCIVGNARVAAVTNTGTASIATFTVGAADGTFEVSANALITTSTTHSFSLDCTYTDESSASRTLVLPASALAGTFITTGLITNVTGVGPYHTPAMTIRCKAATAITIRTSAGGTFTNVVYNAEGVIKQIA